MEKEKSIVKKLLDDLKGRFTDTIISIYGIGSFFDNSLPPDWIKKDLDLIIIVKSLESIPKPEWTDIRYERKKIEDYEVWLAFTTLEAYQNKEIFEKQSFSNYEWSLIDLKIPQNSAHLYGQNIREQLPDISQIGYDFDDILARSLYHFDNSFKAALTSKNKNDSMREFTKGVFKLGFYLCIYFDKEFQYTSIRKIAIKIEELHKNNILDDLFITALKSSIVFRRTNIIPENYIQLRNNMLLYVFSLIGKGNLHRKMTYHELIDFLERTFSGFKYLVKFARKVKRDFKKLRSKN